MPAITAIVAKSKCDRVTYVTYILHLEFQFSLHLSDRPRKNSFMSPQTLEKPPDLNTPDQAQFSTVQKKAHFLDLIYYFRNYRNIAIFSIVGMSLFEVIDLFVPYAIGQILNLLSKQPIDPVLQSLVQTVATTLNQPVTQSFSLWVLAGTIGVISIGRAPIQPWIGPWFQWDTALRARRDHAQKALEQILTLPIEYCRPKCPQRKEVTSLKLANQSAK